MKTITSQVLYELLSSQAGNVLLLDTRCCDEFNAGCIAGAVSVYCSGALILRRLKKGNFSVESLLGCDEDKYKYTKAKESELVSVVVYDQDTTRYSDLPTDCLASLLLKKLSREVKSLSFLEGGYRNFHEQCPLLCCEPENACNDDLPLLQSRPSSLVLQLNNLTMACDSDSCQSSESDDSNPSSPVQSRNPQPFEILSHLYLGCRGAASNKQSLLDNSISRILNVTSEASEYQHLDNFAYFQIPVEDSHEVDMLQYLPRAFAFIEEARLSNEKVLVHCHAGMSRSVTVVIGYLMKFYGHTLNSAYDYVRQKKSNISPNFSFLNQLLQFECTLRPSPSDSGIDSESSSPIDGHCSLDVFNSSSTNLSSPNFVRRCILAA